MKKDISDLFGDFDEKRWGDEAMLDEIRQEEQEKKEKNAWNTTIPILTKTKTKTSNKIKGFVREFNGDKGIIVCDKNEEYLFSSVTKKMKGISINSIVLFQVGRLNKNNKKTCKNIQIL
ncbi:hypothetical protein JO84_gp338 [Aureococcus anophagefferens virus]|uniref:Uncharacterized protein n=1 Tax=Aureococcus anophagefferens virus TaxID=1474867 RepID=A0A076FHR0_9VIRU|nr:hypothetical protein JO84_gp338 [Aureococcus anophagefferens virus]AII16961.1 hypothetical protein AaV_135 [Aureococcus anophagefferens virus]UOG94049.1 hypothetical protein MKD35_7 [Aureococcus anophagefferens virus]